MRVKHFTFAILIIVVLSACGRSATEIAGPTAVPTNTPPPTATIIPTPSTPLANVITPNTGTIIEIRSYSAQGNFLQVQVRPVK